MKTNKISTKIKTLGGLFIFLMIAIIFTTIYLTNKNKKDSLSTSIAGKERMLTQKISKNIFYLHHMKSSNFIELNNSIDEFIQNLNYLKQGNKDLGIVSLPTYKIAEQFYKVEILWKQFYQNIEEFKKLQIQDEIDTNKSIKNIVKAIHTIDNVLLNEINTLVTMYTNYSEEKNDLVRRVQYVAALFILLLVFYSVTQLKNIEENANKLIELSKKMLNSGNNNYETLKIDSKEKEILEVTNTFNCFINKVNLAMNESAVAMEHSKNACSKLEEITDEFDKILDDLENSKDINSQLNKSEDIIIQSTEDMMNSTKKLQELKKELDKLLLTKLI